MSGLSHLADLGGRQGSSLYIKYKHKILSFPVPRLGHPDVMTQDCVSVPCHAEKLGESRTPSGCSSNTQFPGAAGAVVPAWCLKSSVQCPDSVPEVAAKQVHTPIQPRWRWQRSPRSLALWGGFGCGSGCTAFLCSCPLSKPQALAFLTNLWAAQHLAVNSCSSFCCLTGIVIHKESSPIQ